ncbi:transcriptional regulator [Candidatus Enterococcus ferrettii]|uniref:Transcriptional regulator n=1 Tax=Candidatus Enterococcus ferrettii TaxID=2815324 RepID=A0ABV0ES07_9ENTE|nr:transcriptional regulator [Enterococcus sp. 665A]MBO1340388.1 transcriptional regulator [Enterococcus sp. 665A]
MNKATRTHIRNILWDIKTIKKVLRNISDVTLDQKNVFLDYPVSRDLNTQWNINQLVFHKMFLTIVEETLSNSPDQITTIFESKYLNGYPSKDNAVVASDVYLSESTIKRYDNEFLQEIAVRLGW